MKAVFWLIRMLSLDVVLGAFASGMLVIFWLEVAMPLSWWIILPLSVWVIYTADHLLDAYRLKGEAHTDRHLFHHAYFKPLLICWGLMLISAAGLMPFFLPIELVYFGFGMGGLVLLHLLLVWLIGGKTSGWFQKELGVGLIYAAGIWGGPYVLHGRMPQLDDLLLFTQFFLLAMINLLIFSRYEEKIDEMDQQTSFVRALGQWRSMWLIRFLFGLIICLACLLLCRVPTLQGGIIQALLLSMGLMLAWINESPGLFAPQHRYRIWGDAVFIFPLSLWLWL